MFALTKNLARLLFDPTTRVRISPIPRLFPDGVATMGDVILDDCFVTDERCLGESGAGGFMLLQALELERAFIFAGLLGVMEWQLAEVVKLSRQRMVGGQPLARKQAISHRIAEMKTRLDTSRLWVRYCAQLKDAGQRLTLVSAQTKLFASMASRLFSGSPEIQKNIIAALLGTGESYRKPSCG